MDAAIFGLIVADVIAQPMNLRRPPAPGGLTMVQSIQLTSGGNVCNTGTAMARLGMSVAAAGLVGDDVLGQAVVDQLRHAGVDTAAVFRAGDAQTSATVVAVEPGGERCFFHTPGATTALDAGLFRRCMPVFRNCGLLQIGYFGLLPALTRDLPEVLAELRYEASGLQIALDTVNPPAEWKLLAPILPHVDIFCPSRTEAEALSGLRTPKKMIAFFRKHMKHGLIGIKLDAEGCLLDDGDQQLFVPSYKIDVVDTTGAGDTWFAGLLTGLRQNLPLEQCGRLANRVAADCCTALGASAGVRNLQDTLARL
jgi:sugar/nucleoside kinase (ribokinase family)